MDNTQEYIKMCEKAVEVQDLRPKHHTKHDCWITVIEFESLGKEGWVWLPRQDQLQEMVSTHLDFLMGKISDFWGNTPGHGSMEQLWLAFVMKEKYNKIWLENEWVLEVEVKNG